MVIFGDEDSTVEHFVEIDARVFCEGTAYVASGVSVDGPDTRGFPGISLRSQVLTQGLNLTTLQ